MNSKAPNEVMVASAQQEGEEMKKRIVYFLCEKRMFKIANKISPSLVGKWRGEKVAQGIAKALENSTNVISNFSNALQDLMKQITKENETDDK